MGLPLWPGVSDGVLVGAGYKANLVAAGESDSRLEARLQQQQVAFGALSLDHAVAQMPRLQARPCRGQPLRWGGGRLGPALPL